MRAAPPDGALDHKASRRHGLIAGVDEVGRGALAGPVTVAAVILDPERPIEGLDDSKRLSPRTRERLAEAIRAHALCWAVVHRSPAEIDRINILEATRSAMTEAVLALARTPGLVVSDAVALPGLSTPVLAETRADSRYQCVAAASILAKVVRDRAMVSLARSHPGYGWESNKGYPSPAHLAALRRLGVSTQHRRSFAPVRVLG
ncbi:MAG: ribonuclease HII [Thermoanaerobaculaceae bacterium]